MADKKDKWGAKRTCPECETKFYDLGKNPAKCPKCGSEFEISELLKHTVAAKLKRIRKSSDLDDEDAEVKFADDEIVESDPNAEDDELAIIEDASDIGDDTHDMAEVIGNLEKDRMGE